MYTFNKIYTETKQILKKKKEKTKIVTYFC